jgi:hypothetical protein
VVRPVPLAAIPGAAIPEVAVDSLAIAGGQQIAVGYPAIWRKTTAGSWTLVSPLSLVSGQPGLGALTSVTHGPADVWWSPNLASWTHAHDVNDVTGSSQVLAVAAGPHGFISAGSHNGQPAVWTTTDGPAWTTLVLPLPSGATSGVLQQIAISGNRVVALGRQVVGGVTTPLAELSTDGGATWQPVPFAAPGPDPAITALTADRGGFTAAVQAGTPGQPHVTLWTSADGATWAQAPASGRFDQLTALAPAGPVITAIGPAGTVQSQQPVVLTLPAR